MPRKQSGMALSHSWWPQINCVHLLSVVKHTASNLVAENNMCHLPVSTGEDLVVTELDVKRQTGLPSHLLAQLGEDPSAFCSAVWPRADLSSSRAEGRKASASSCGCLHRELPTWQLPSSEWSREKSQRRGRGRGGERERGRGRGW